jgi:hypothetical protein
MLACTVRNRQDHTVVTTSHKHVRCETFQVNSAETWRCAASKRIQAKAISSVRQTNRTYRPRYATRVTTAHNGSHFLVYSIIQPAKPPLSEEIPVLQPSRFYPGPSGRDNAKTCEDSIFGISVCHCVDKVYGLIQWRNLRPSVILWAFFSPRKFMLIFLEF